MADSAKMRKVCLTRSSKFALFHSIDEVGSSMYFNYDEWASALTVIDATTKAVLGRQGQHYVEEHYSWRRVESDYLTGLKLLD